MVGMGGGGAEGLCGIAWCGSFLGPQDSMTPNP